jgi:hypothetical protein
LLAATVPMTTALHWWVDGTIEVVRRLASIWQA